MTTTAKRQRQREGRVARMEAERRAAQKAARKRRVITVLVVVVVVLAVMALISVLSGDDDEGGEDAAPASEAPEVTIPEGPPPTELESEDLVEGDGDELQEGDTALVRYVGKVYESGEEFDSNYDDAEPAPIQIVSPGVIDGWAEGLPGMRVGGRRQLVVPPELGYGEEGQPPDIPGGATLVFVIDLEGIQPAQPAPPAPPAPPATPPVPTPPGG